MGDRRRDLAKVSVIGACLVVAGVLWWRSASGGGPTGIESVDADQTLLTRCANPDCQFQTDMNKRVYFGEVLKRQSRNPNLSHPPLDCSKCGESSVFRVHLCPKCDHVFKHGGTPNEAADRCPKCRYSQSLEDRKQGV